MKRILIRMTALTTVVALGLVAIALAQRDGEGSPAPAAADGGTPKLLSFDGQDNPLRDASGPSSSPRYEAPATIEPFDRYPTIAQTSGSAASGVAPYVQPSSYDEATPYAQPADPFLATHAPEATGYPTAPQQGDSVSIEPPNSINETAYPAADSNLFASEMPSVSADEIDLGQQYLAQAAAAQVDASAGGMPSEPGYVAAGSSGNTMPASDFGSSPPPSSEANAPEPLPSEPGLSTITLPMASSPREFDSGGYDLDIAVPSAASVAGTGKPGPTQLEGTQTPQLTIEKFAPEEIQVGKPAVFIVKVANTGQTTAHGVEIRDEVPRGTRLVGTDPPAKRGAQGELVWTLGAMKPGEENTVELEVMPESEGEIGSVATVHFRVEASARTIATKPELIVKTTAPRQVLIGDDVKISISVSNPGSGVASGVVIVEHVPVGLEHPAGTELEYTIGDLAPNESRELELTMTADQAGKLVNVLSAKDDASLDVEDRLEIEVIAPQLDVAMAGPKKRYLERTASYTLSVSNPGTAPAQAVELVAYLPTGLDFVSADKSGQYQEATRTVHWNLLELPVQESDSVKLVTMPVDAGEHLLRLTGSDETGLLIEREHEISVEGIAAIMFQVVDVEDPIELGGETTYEIKVLNQGSKAATNVQLVAIVPPEMRAIAAEGPTRHKVEGNRVVFGPLSRLAPKADTTYRVRVQGLHPGDLRMRVQLLTDEIDTPVTKEESTRVYSDE